MPLPPLPPLKDTLQALQQDVLPGAGGAALVMCVFLLVGRWAAATGAAAAVIVAFIGGNFTLSIAGTEQPTWDNTARLIPWKPEAAAPGYDWLPQATLLLMAVGLVSRWIGLVSVQLLDARYWWGPGAFVWLPRLAAVVVVSGWLVRGHAAQGPEWASLQWELSGATLLVWFVLDELARKGLGAEVAAYLAAALFAGGLVLLYAHNARFMELAVLMGSTMFGIAVAVGILRSRPITNDNPNPNLHDAHKPEPIARTELPLGASGAIPAGVMFLVGLVLGTRPSHVENHVPAACFWLISLGLALLAPFLIPRLARQNQWLLLAGRILLVLVPLTAAVVLASNHETLPYK